MRLMIMITTMMMMMMMMMTIGKLWCYLFEQQTVDSLCQQSKNNIFLKRTLKIPTVSYATDDSLLRNTTDARDDKKDKQISRNLVTFYVSNRWLENVKTGTVMKTVRIKRSNRCR
uniref:Secreted protein n=1 Tax=Octopus bimaculoides TaxID=37653 RepID=A0A0L8FN21_OCTBM